MTELEQARAHLLNAQKRLHLVRTGQEERLPFNVPPFTVLEAIEYEHRVQVLAALSWVWDAQRRAETGNHSGDKYQPELAMKAMDLLTNVEWIDQDEPPKAAERADQRLENMADQIQALRRTIRIHWR